MYWFGVNSDDGFAVLSGTPGVTNGVQLGAFNLSGGKGFSDVPFSFIVPQAGLYPIRLVWHKGENPDQRPEQSGGDQGLL
jgi:hypothetical protein